MELQETARLRGKRERDRDREPSKRRRGSHSHSTEEESVGNDQDGDVFGTGLSRLLSSNTASSAPDQNHRRTFGTMPPPPPPPPPSTNITREIIGVMVPRKARSGHTHSQNACCITNQKFRIRSLLFADFFFWGLCSLCEKDA